MVARFLIALLVLLPFSGMMAQESIVDLVYLTNGTYLRGTVIEIIPGQNLSIIVTNSDTLIIPMTEVERMTKDTICSQDRKGYEQRVKAWGYTCIPEVCVGYGVQEGIQRYNDPVQYQYALMISVFNGVTITPYIQLGLGSGLDIWKYRIFLPVYFDLRANLLKRANTPFFEVLVGYALGWTNGQEGAGLGGAISGLGAGGRFKISERQSMVVSLGYRFQQSRLWQEVAGVKSKATIDAYFINLRMGIFF